MSYRSNATGIGGIQKILFVLVILFVAYEMSVLSININSPIHFAFISFALIGLVCYLFWEKTLSFLFLWIVFAGVFRKWIFPNLEEVIFFFTYVILAGASSRYFIRQLMNRDKITIPNPANALIGFQLIWAIACMFNPSLPNPLVSILGLIVYFSYIPMIYMIPRITTTKEQLLKLFKIFVFISIPVMTLGIIQFFFPPDHPINYYVSNTGEQEIATAGGHARVTSTFAYLSGYATYLTVLIFVITYLLSLRKASFRFTIFLLVLLGFALLNILTTGSRGPTVFTIASIIGYSFLAGLLNREFFKKFALRIILGVLITLLFFYALPAGKNIVEAFMSRANDSQDIGPRLVDTYTTPFRLASICSYYGFGLGITYQGSSILGNNLDKIQALTGGFEEEPERVVIEMGVVGFILVYSMRAFFIILFWRLYRKLKDPDLKFLALISVFFQFQFLGLAAVFFNTANGVFYWFVISFLYLLPKLDTQEVKQETKEESSLFARTSSFSWRSSRFPRFQ